MMHLEWLHNPVEARCPICNEAGRKQAVLSTDHVLAGHEPVTLARCPCGVAFLLDQNPPDYEHGLLETLDYYVEQGAGIDLIVEPLLRLAPGSVRRCLEIGCSYGFALDFGRSALGWEVLGVDPSPLAEVGSKALGLPVHRGYFDAGLDLGPEPFDLALCSEVVEHLAEPRALLSALRERLSADGLLVLSTPNLALIHPGTEEGALRRALSPGFHLVLYDADSLTRLLESAGFAAVRVEESPETLRAFAGLSEAALRRLGPGVPPERRDLLRDYFRERAATAPPGSPLACGFAYRHFKECVNAGRYEEAVASRERLTRVWREGYGLDLERPETVTAALAAGRTWAGPGRLPFNVTGALFFSGILELNHLGNPGRAAGSFAAAVATGDVLLRIQQPFGLADGETEALLGQSRKHLPMALAATDPERAVREVEALERNAPADAGLLDGTRAQTFIRLVNAGAYEAAERLAPRVLERIGDGADREDLDALFCLGMLALQRKRSVEAAEMFGRVRRLASPEHADLLKAARLHEEILRPPAPHGSRTLIIAERFLAPAARLSGVWLPLDVVALRPAERLRIVILAEDETSGHRSCTLLRPRLSPVETLRLQFVPFDSPAGATFLLGVLALPERDETPLADDSRAVRSAAAGRVPIGLDTCGEGDARLTPDLVPGEEGIATFRIGRSGSPEIRTAHALDAYWCDAHGLYLRGWAHAHEHRVRALRVESTGRSARVETFSDRPDLLVHYPAHEHVRHAGFAVYLACPPGHPVHLTLETDGGEAGFLLPLPEGPIPAWPAEPGNGDEVSPLLRRFVELANAGGGRVLQIGARSMPEATPEPAHRLLRARPIGLDIHPGHRVDLVGDAHGLSRFLRGGSLGAVFSSAVLEHLEAPWLLAAEINRVLAPGGVVYQQAPGAWPAHAQPTDFWRMSAEGLKVLFGPETGFEVLEARDSGPAVLLPTPEWRAGFLDMPTVPVYTMAEILVRKVAEIPSGAVAWPLDASRSEGRSRRYPVEGLHPHRAERGEW